MKDKIFNNDAKQIVDCLFDTKVFKDGITRDNMNEVEELINYMLKTRFESYKRLEALTDKVK